MIRAALGYFAGVFMLEFLLGTLRSLGLAPLLGATLAVLCEIPVMLGASLWLAPRLMRRWGIARLWPALAMGTLAFACLMLAEAGLASVVLGQGMAQWFRALWQTPGWIGLAGQVGFALIPAICLLRQPAP